jgi:hypothetical protein
MHYTIESSSIPVAPIFDVYDSKDKLVVAGVTESQATQLILYLKDKDRCDQDFKLSLAY